MLDIYSISEQEINKFILKQVRGIEKCIVREDQRDGKPVKLLQTQGINLTVNVDLLKTLILCF